MNPQFPLYIPSKGRADTRMTAKALERLGVPYTIVVEEHEADDYRAVTDPELGEVLVLDPQYQIDYEVLDGGPHNHSPEPRGVGPGAARNFIWDHSIAQGHDWHWVMDDNIQGFWRLYRNRKLRMGDGTGFRVMEDFCLRYANVAMAGPNYYMFASRKSAMPPFVINTRIYSCNLIRNDVPFRWRGRYNEDTILSLDMLKAGWCTVQFNAFLQWKTTTQLVRGGNTAEFYDREGTLPKSQMLVDVHPDVSRLAYRFSRIHHYVDYGPFKSNRLVRADGVKIEPGINEYGLVLTDKPERGDQLFQVEVKGFVATCRRETSDAFIIDEVIKGNTYRKLNLSTDDVVLDVGMNIGAFSMLASRSCARVVGYEPDPDNFRLAEQNLIDNGCENVEAHCAAATGTDEEERTFSINVKRNKGAHSLVEKRGRDSLTVAARHLQTILDEVRPTVVKMDIEGGEDECIHAVTDFYEVRELIIEFHHADLNENDPDAPRPRYAAMLEKLRRHFEVVEYVKEPKKAWVTLIYCRRSAG